MLPLNSEQNISVDGLPHKLIKQSALSTNVALFPTTTSTLKAMKNAFEGSITTSNGASTNKELTQRSQSSMLPSPWHTFCGLHTSRDFQSDASIILIGIRGAGKSSLGYLAASLLRRQLVDADQYFFQKTGLSRAAYRRDHTAAEYRSCEVQVLRWMLLENDKNCVIACGPGCVEEYGREFLQEYAKSHPVVYVLREQQAIQKYLNIPEGDRMIHLLEISEPTYRACSNLEFYNLTELQQSIAMDERLKNEELAHRVSPNTTSLALKHIERDFLRFLAFISRRLINPITTKPFIASYVAPDPGTYTYALLLPLSKLVDYNDIESLETGVDAIELNIDIPVANISLDEYLSPRNISRQLARLRRKTNLPIIFSVQKESLSCASSNPDLSCSYFDLLHHGLRLGVEYIVVDISSDEQDIQGLLAEKGSTKVIGNFRNESEAIGWDHPDCLAQYHSIRLLGCDIVRLSQHATTLEDNFALLRFRKRIDLLDYPHPPLIAYNTGDAGRVSFCFGPFMTPVTHPMIRTAASSMVTAQEAQKALYANFVLDKMLFCAFGAAVTYSLIPAMHGAAAEACGMPHQWRVCESDSLKDLAALFEDPNFGGATISLPFKIEVISLLNSLSPHAKVIGAVNSVIPIRKIADRGLKDIGLRAQRNRAGALEGLHGDNTDWIGIRSCIRHNLSPANSITHNTTGLILGAGGMARAAIYALLQLRVSNIFIYNRTYMNAVNLAEHYNSQGPLEAADSEENVAAHPRLQSSKYKIHVLKSLQDLWPKPFRQPTIVVCCVPAHSTGDQPAPNYTIPTPWFQSPTGGVVVELAYKILNTSLLQQVWAESHRGWVGVDGLDVLPEQGFAQFEVFTGRNAPRRLMREEVLRNYRGEAWSYKNKENIKTRLASISQDLDVVTGR